MFLLGFATAGVSVARKPQIQVDRWWAAASRLTFRRMHKRLHPPKFNSPRLALIWAALGTCNADEALEFVIELEKMLGRGTFPTTRSKDKQADAIACLREAAQIVSGSPSIRQYETLRKNRPDLDLVPAGTIRTRLAGNWNECLRRAQLEEAPDDGYASSINPAFTEAELLDVIRECARDTGATPVVVTYRAWAKRPDVIVRPGKRPLTESPFKRRFGSFRAAVVAAGFEPNANARRSRPTVNAFAYSEAECHAALRLVYDQYGFSPSVQEYEQVRTEIRSRAQAGEDLEPLPSPSLLMRRFRTWALALEAAGLPPRRIRDFVGKRPSLSERTVLLRRTDRDLGSEGVRGCWRAVHRTGVQEVANERSLEGGSWLAVDPEFLDVVGALSRLVHGMRDDPSLRSRGRRRVRRPTGARMSKSASADDGDRAVRPGRSSLGPYRTQCHSR